MISRFFRFELTSVTPSYEDYLKCFGMPSFIVSLVMSSEEAMKIEDHANGTITLHTITGKIKFNPEVVAMLMKHVTSLFYNFQPSIISSLYLRRARR